MQQLNSATLTNITGGKNQELSIKQKEDLKALAHKAWEEQIGFFDEVVPGFIEQYPGLRKAATGQEKQEVEDKIV